MIREYEYVTTVWQSYQIDPNGSFLETRIFAFFRKKIEKLRVVKSCKSKLNLHPVKHLPQRTNLCQAQKRENHWEPSSRSERAIFAGWRQA